MLEYLQVPSPFVGTETVLDPIKFAFPGTHVVTPPNAPGGPIAGESSMVPGGQELDGTAGLHPPFNTVSNYRDPGRVNINTIADPQAGAVWNAIRGAANAQSNTIGGPTFQDIAPSRQGYPGNLYQFESSGKYPSIFSNPFRAARWRRHGATAWFVQKPVNASIWRAEGPTPDSSTTGLPLLALRPTTQPYNSYFRNPYFFYETMGRLTNKITMRSNVYAVWVTVGYFEVTPWTAGNLSPNARR